MYWNQCIYVYKAHTVCNEETDVGAWHPAVPLARKPEQSTTKSGLHILILMFSYDFMLTSLQQFKYLWVFLFELVQWARDI